MTNRIIQQASIPQYLPDLSKSNLVYVGQLICALYINHSTHKKIDVFKGSMILCLLSILHTPSEKNLLENQPGQFGTNLILVHIVFDWWGFKYIWIKDNLIFENKKIIIFFLIFCRASIHFDHLSCFFCWMDNPLSSLWIVLPQKLFYRTIKKLIYIGGDLCFRKSLTEDFRSLYFIPTTSFIIANTDLHTNMCHLI